MADEKTAQKVSLLAQVLAQGQQRRLALLEQYTINNRVYKEERINLDGYTFRNCAFINCDLQTAKGNFHLQSCHIHLCRIYFTGNALRVVRLASMLLETWEQLDEGLRSYFEADGSVTII